MPTQPATGINLRLLTCLKDALPTLDDAMQDCRAKEKEVPAYATATAAYERQTKEARDAIAQAEQANRRPLQWFVNYYPNSGEASALFHYRSQATENCLPGGLTLELKEVIQFTQPTSA